MRTTCIVILMCLLQWYVSAGQRSYRHSAQQAQQANAAQPPRDTDSSDQPGIEITTVEHQDVQANGEVRLPAIDEAEGVSIELTPWAAPAGSYACVLVHALGSPRGRAYCTRTVEGEANAVVRMVALGEGFSQVREYALRAALFTAPPVRGEVDVRECLNTAIAHSDAKRVTVLKREVVEQGPDAVAITNINGITVDSREPQMVDASANMEGTWEQANTEPCEDWNGAQQAGPCIAVAAHAVGTDEWRVLGMADVSDHHWMLRDASIADRAQTLESSYDLFPFLSKKRLEASVTTYSHLQSMRMGSSPAIRVVVRSAATPPPLDQPEVQLTYITTTEGRRAVSGPTVFRLGVNEVPIEAEGDTNRPMEAGSYYVAAVEKRGTYSYICGPAAFTGAKWRVKLTGRASLAAARGVEVFGFVSTSKQLPSTSTWTAWRKQAAAISQPVMMDSATGQNPTDLEITIDKLDDRKWSGSIMQAPRRFGLQGSAPNVPLEMKVCIALRPDSQDHWTIVCSGARYDDRWFSPAMDVVAETGAADARGAWDLVAFLADADPPRFLPIGELPNFAAVMSSRHSFSIAENTADSKQGDRHTAATIIQLSILTLLLGLVEYYSRGVSTAAGEVAGWLEAVLRRMKSKYPCIEDEVTTAEMRGLLLIAVGVVAMFFYFPMYRDALREVFSLTRSGATAMAITLILFNAIAGAVFESMLEHRGLTRVFAGTVFFAFVSCFWVFQSVMYYAHFSKPPSDEQRGLAMGMAAFFMSVCESALFFKGFQKSGKLLTSIVPKSIHGVLSTIAGWLRIVENTLQKMRNYVEAAEHKKKISV